MSLARTSRLLAYLRLARPSDALVVALGTLVGARLAGLAQLTSLLVLEVTLSNTLLFVASVIINDCHDVKEDAINRPGDPIPSGLISPAAGRVVGSLLFCVAIGLASAVTPSLGAFAAVITLLSVLYSTHLKSVPFAGNGLVAAIVTYPLWCWTFLASGVATTLVELSFSCFVFRMGAEIVKTAEDYIGDAFSGVRTVATTRGPGMANRLGSALMLSGLLLCWLPVLNGRGGVLYGLLLGTSLCLLALHSIREALRSRPDIEVGRSLVTVERYIMALMSLATLSMGTGWPR